MAKRKKQFSDSYMSLKAPKGVKSGGSALILNGIKYKAGKPPVRVCPAPIRGQASLAQPLK
jgi:hypothetical protein